MQFQAVDVWIPFFPLSVVEMLFLVVYFTNYNFLEHICISFMNLSFVPYLGHTILKAEDSLYSGLNNKIYHSIFNINLVSLISTSSI